MTNSDCVLVAMLWNIIAPELYSDEVHDSRGPPGIAMEPPAIVGSKLTLTPLSSVLALLVSDSLLPAEVACTPLPEGYCTVDRKRSSLFPEDGRLLE